MLCYDLTFLWLLCFVKSTESRFAGYACKSVEDPLIDFEAVFRFNRNNDVTITGLVAYTAAENPTFVTTVQDAGCITNVLDGEIYTMTIFVDEDGALPCGIKQDDVTASIYHFAIGTIGKAEVYTFDCDRNTLQIPHYIQQNDFYTGHITASKTFLRTAVDETKFEVLLPDDRQVPADWDIPLGESIKLRLTYTSTTTPTTTESEPLFQSGLLGRSFHMAFPVPSTMPFTSATLRLRTLSEDPTSVKVWFGNITGSPVVTESVLKDSHFDINVPRLLTIITGNETSWQISMRAIKIVSEEADIWTELRVNYIDQSSAVTNIHPDEVLGKKYRFIAPIADADVYLYGVIVAAADNSQITLTFQDPNIDGALEIDSNLVGSVTSYVLQLSAGETLDMTCVRQLGVTIEVTSSEKVAFLYGGLDRVFLQIPAKHNSYTDFFYMRDDLLRPDLFTFYSTDPSVFFNFTSSYNGTSPLLDYLFDIVTDPTTYQYSPGILNTATLLVKDELDYDAFVLPAVEQWNTHYLFYFEAGDTAVFFVGGNTSSLANIRVMQQGSDDLMTAILTGVTAQGTSLPGPGSLDSYEQYIARYDVLANGSIEFKAGNLNQPFIVYAGVIKAGRVTAYVPLGYRYKCLDDQDVVKDCQEHVQPSTEEVVPVSVNRLLVSAEESFASSILIHDNGCNVQPNSYLSTIHPFERKPDFDSVWVMDTLPFKTFGFSGHSSVYFRLEFEYCFGNITRCSDSCQDGAQINKRSASTRSIAVKLNMEGRRQSCTVSRYYWVPHLIIFLMIVIQVAAITYMLSVKWRLGLRTA